MSRRRNLWLFIIHHSSFIVSSGPFSLFSAWCAGWGRLVGWKEQRNHLAQLVQRVQERGERCRGVDHDQLPLRKVSPENLKPHPLVAPASLPPQFLLAETGIGPAGFFLGFAVGQLQQGFQVE